MTRIRHTPDPTGVWPTLYARLEYSEADWPRAVAEKMCGKHDAASASLSFYYDRECINLRARFPPRAWNSGFYGMNYVRLHPDSRDNVVVWLPIAIEDSK